MCIRDSIKANQGRLLIQAVNAPRLFDWLIDGIEPPGLATGRSSQEAELSEDALEALAG